MNIKITLAIICGIIFQSCAQEIKKESKRSIDIQSTSYEYKLADYLVENS